MHITQFLYRVTPKLMDLRAILQKDALITAFALLVNHYYTCTCVYNACVFIAFYPYLRYMYQIANENIVLANRVVNANKQKMRGNYVHR